MVPINIISGISYLNSSMIVGVLSFIPLWKFYNYTTIRYEYAKRYLKYLLFIPSYTLWGSGILKDTFTASFIIGIVYILNKMFFEQKITFKYLLILFFYILGIINIKPYLFIGLFPAVIIWLSWSRIKKIENKTLKYISTPIVFAIAIALGFGIWTYSSQFLGSYSSLESIISKTHVTYYDLKQDYYKGNSFDLGDYDASLQGILSKFPIAWITGMFRPFIWESQNFLMLFSGLENLILLLLSFYIIWKNKSSFFKRIFNDSLIVFCLTFSIVMAFAIAISTTNYGALVRFKIPILPFYLLFLIIMSNKKPNLNRV